MALGSIRMANTMKWMPTSRLSSRTSHWEMAHLRKIALNELALEQQNKTALWLKQIHDLHIKLNQLRSSNGYTKFLTCDCSFSSGSMMCTTNK